MSKSYRVGQTIAPKHIDLIRQGKYALTLQDEATVPVNQDGFLDAKDGFGTAFILAETAASARKMGILDNRLQLERNSSWGFFPRLRVDVSSLEPEDAASSGGQDDLAASLRLDGRVAGLEMKLDYLASMLPPDTAAARKFVVETGRLTMANLLAVKTARRVEFAKTFQAPPVVKATISSVEPLKTPTLALNVRGEDVDSTGFRFDIWPWNIPPHESGGPYDAVIKWTATGF
ncbi:hypothetical protein HRG_009348 [Hirsutella rhossiliensis]|uniref:Uncharacterized protein n=1 Tax=Hirsutella rhossiliensis TaxID=111463 RepID=A0A9P8SED8_9HYPO|nr:uncharacterized protein HRG_09348 [Hirsutella rhossiliensis]KAH0959566.1 hypothetical protein HRG_09348 [Hirsutella rhossiliensis]